MKIMNLKFRFFATGLVLGMLFGVFIGRIGRIAFPPASAVVGTATFEGVSQTLSGDITAARIVDGANSAYFIDPAAAGTSLSLAGNASVSGTMTMASNQPFRPAFGPVKLDYKSGPDAYTTGLIIQDTTGNVGIGTQTPAQKLSVAGTVESTSGGFKFPDGTSQASAASGLPAGMIAFFAAACPSGWTEYTAARGMYIVGNPASGTLATAVGTALTNLENRAVGQHNHGITDPGHSHGIPRAAYAGAAGYPFNEAFYETKYTNSNTTGITINNDGSVAGTNAPYIQLTACQKN